MIKFTQKYQAPFQQVETPQATLQVYNTQQQFLPQIQNTSRTAQQFQIPPQNTLGMPLERQNSKTPKYQYAFDIPQQSQTPIRPQVQTQSQIDNHNKVKCIKYHLALFIQQISQLKLQLQGYKIQRYKP